MLPGHPLAAWSRPLDWPGRRDRMMYSKLDKRPLPRQLILLLRHTRNHVHYGQLQNHHRVAGEAVSLNLLLRSPTRAWTIHAASANRPTCMVKGCAGCHAGTCTTPHAGIKPSTTAVWVECLASAATIAGEPVRSSLSGTTSMRADLPKLLVELLSQTSWRAALPTTASILLARTSHRVRQGAQV